VSTSHAFGVRWWVVWYQPHSPWSMMAVGHECVSRQLNDAWTAPAPRYSTLISNPIKALPETREKGGAKGGWQVRTAARILCAGDLDGAARPPLVPLQPGRPTAHALTVHSG